MPSDRPEPAIASSPGILADEMADATKRLRERAWMISPLTARPGVVEHAAAEAEPPARSA